MITQPVVLLPTSGVIPAPPGDAAGLFHVHDINGARNVGINNGYADGTAVRWINHSLERTKALFDIYSLMGTAPPLNGGLGTPWAWLFNGSTDTLTIPVSTGNPFSGGPPAGLDFIHKTGVFDIFLAFRSNAAGKGGLLGNVDDPSTQAGFKIYIGGGNTLQFDIHTQSGIDAINYVCGTQVNNPGWTKAFFRGDGSNLQLAMNTPLQVKSWETPGAVAYGTLDPTHYATNDTTLGTAFGSGYFGSLPDPTNNFDGEMAELLIYDRNLDDFELGMVDAFFQDRVRVW